MTCPVRNLGSELPVRVLFIQHPSFVRRMHLRANDLGGEEAASREAPGVWGGTMGVVPLTPWLRLLTGKLPGQPWGGQDLE